MAPEVLDEVDAYPGNTWAFAVTVRDKVTGAPINITGATLEATISGTPGWTGTPQIIAPLTGQTEVIVLSASTVNFSPGKYLCDVLMTLAGIPQTVKRFWVNVKPVGSLP
jgi:hypothetical protein